MYLHTFQSMLQSQANQRRVWAQLKKQQSENHKQVTNKQSDTVVKEVRK